jgi:hypothetical protein
MEIEFEPDGFLDTQRHRNLRRRHAEIGEGDAVRG